MRSDQKLDVKLDETGELKQVRTVVNLIKNHDALVKMISSPIIDDQHWIFLLDQFADPKNKRPYKQLQATANRNRIYDTVQKFWVDRKASSNRGGFKETQYIKKTSTSLLPPTARMNYFNASGYNVGILFDINKCKLKNKYIFSTNMATNAAWWIAGQAPEQDVKNTSHVSLQDLKVIHKESKSVLDWNEILACPSKNSISAIFAPKDRCGDRLNALHKKYLMKERLGIDVPIFKITPEKGLECYTAGQQFQDIISALTLAPETVSNQFLQRLPFLRMQYFMHSFSAKIVLAVPPEQINQIRSLALALAMQEKKYDKVASILEANGIQHPEELAAIENDLDISKTEYTNEFLDSKLGLHLIKHLRYFLYKIISVAKNSDIDSLVKKYTPICLATDSVLLVVVARKMYPLAIWMLTKTKIKFDRNYKEPNEHNDILHLAVLDEKPNLTLVKEIIRSSSFLYEKNRANKTAIDIILEKKHYSIIEMWLTHFGEKVPPAVLSFILTKLLLDKNITLVKLILKLELKFDPNYVFPHDDKAEIMQIAVGISDDDLISLLITNGFGIGKKASSGKSAIINLVYQPEKFKHLLKIGSHTLAKDYAEELFKKLLNINHMLAIELLKAKPKMIYTVDAKTGNTIYHNLAAEKQVDSSILNYIAKSDVKLKTKNLSGLSAIDIAVKNQHDRFIMFFINLSPKKIPIDSLANLMNYLIEFKKLESFERILNARPEVKKQFENASQLTPMRTFLNNLDEKSQPDRWIENLTKAGINFEELNEKNLRVLTALAKIKAFRPIYFVLERYVSRVSSAQLIELLLLSIQHKEYRAANLILEHDPSLPDQLQGPQAISNLVTDDKPNLDLIDKLCRRNIRLLASFSSATYPPLYMIAKNNKFTLFCLLVDKYADQLNTVALDDLVSQLIKDNYAKEANYLIHNNKLKINYSDATVELAIANQYEAKTINRLAQNGAKITFPDKGAVYEIIRTNRFNYLIALLPVITNTLNDEALEALFILLCYYKLFQQAEYILEHRPNLPMLFKVTYAHSQPLHFICSDAEPSLFLIDRLCNGKANLAAKNASNETPLTLALNNERHDLLKRMLENKNANVTSTHLGEILQLLIKQDKFNLVEWLLALGKPIDQCNAALMLVLEISQLNLKAINGLLKLGASFAFIDFKKNKRHLPLLVTHYFKFFNSKTIFEIINVVLEQQDKGLLKTILQLGVDGLSPDELIIVLNKMFVLEWNDLTHWIFISPTLNKINGVNACLSFQDDAKVVDQLCKKGAELGLLRQDVNNPFKVALSKRRYQSISYFLENYLHHLTDEDLINALTLLFAARAFVAAKPIFQREAVFEKAHKSELNKWLRTTLEDEKPNMSYIDTLLNNSADPFAYGEKSFIVIALSSKNYSVLKSIIKYSGSIMAAEHHEFLHKILLCLLTENVVNIEYLTQLSYLESAEAKKKITISLIKQGIAASARVEDVFSVVSALEKFEMKESVFINTELFSFAGDYWKGRPVTKDWTLLIDAAQLKLIELTPVNSVLNDEIVKFLSVRNPKNSIFKSSNLLNSYLKKCAKEDAGVQLNTPFK